MATTVAATGTKHGGDAASTATTTATIHTLLRRAESEHNLHGESGRDAVLTAYGMRQAEALDGEHDRAPVPRMRRARRTLALSRIRAARASSTAPRAGSASARPPAT